MPLYEYECTATSCGKLTEELRKFEDMEKLEPCPQCGKETRRKISRGSFVLKGSGWSSDGYSG